MVSAHGRSRLACWAVDIRKPSLPLASFERTAFVTGRHSTRTRLDALPGCRAATFSGHSMRSRLPLKVLVERSKKARRRLKLRKLAESKGLARASIPAEGGKVTLIGSLFHRKP
jgi:hypothetical protein